MNDEADERVPAMRLADGSMAFFDTQRIGRMGELVVELELLKRGWVVGNFNHTVLNSAGWDLFATRGDRSVRIRVKSKRPGVECFRWSAKQDGVVFPGFTGAADDFVAAVSFDPDGSYQVYILPTGIVNDTLEAENASWLAGTKRDGSQRKAPSMRHIYMDDRADGRPGRGFATHWACYLDTWNLLGRQAA
jgi:hypothetical protein